VRSALKQLHRSYPETIFFVVPATAALFSTIALGCISLASVVQNQVWKHAARSRCFYDRHPQRRHNSFSPPSMYCTIVSPPSMY
jgi:hypothetical protein